MLNKFYYLFPLKDNFINNKLSYVTVIKGDYRLQEYKEYTATLISKIAMVVTKLKEFKTRGY